jgi:hypothetical protein
MLARTAREALARGLQALQADPRVPPHLVELAAPIAQAMGALHRIESSGGTQLGPNVPAALTSVQAALAGLQAQPPTIEAVAAAMEAVAGALGTVHALARTAQGQGSPQAPRPPTQPQPAVAPVAPAPQPPRPPPAPQPQPQPAVLQAQPPPAAPQAQPQFVQQAYAPTAVAPGQPPRMAPAPAPPQPARGPTGAQRAYAGPSPANAAPGFDVVAAELGAHSPSNFYKGLSGNDIVDHGGLFVSTYKLPQLGSPVRLRVSLPGGYEFEANGVVRWRREPSDAGSDAPPGFGAQFTEITPEARQLVYRYVRNREPMFHDDL